MLNIFGGINASEGIALGRAVVVNKKDEQPAGRKDSFINERERKEHKEMFLLAVQQASKELSLLAEANAIFAAQMEMVNDPMLIDSVNNYIDSNLSAASALDKAKDELIPLFENIDDPYLRERAIDVKDICNRIGENLGEKKRSIFASLPDNSIVIADEILPSDTSEMNLEKVSGFITAKGGYTSHFCIIARNWSIPTITGLGSDELKNIKDGDFIILDSGNTLVVINPDKQTLSNYENKIADKKRKEIESEFLKEIKIVTEEGEKIDIFANAGSVDEVKLAIGNGAEGIGLFRSEFLFMNSNGFPTEEEQFEVYKEAALACGKFPVTIRTLDIGGDKGLPYYTMEKEENPALGLRGIRFCFFRRNVFKTQLRALLRASIYKNIKIMFPMIVSLSELEQALELVDECKKELCGEGLAYNPDTPLGIMIETPAAVFIADKLIRKCDFFSIGTNDLTQYILAVDRNNAAVNHLYQPMHPAVLNAIGTTIKVAVENGKGVGMCGDLASHPEALTPLLGMGLRQFSVSINSILKIKKGCLGVLKGK